MTRHQKRLLSLIVLVLALTFAMSAVPAARADEGDIVGPVEADQSAYTVDEVVSQAANPIPMSPTGPAPPGSYTTELWSDGETNTEYGVQVVSSSATGTAALTAVVQDEATGNTISGASATLACLLDSTSLTTTTDASGGFAFIDVPADNCYTLTVTAPGYGTFQSTHGIYAADSQYSMTIELTSSPQSYDESVATADTAQTISGPEIAPLGAHRRVPPAIRVAEVNRNPDCSFNSIPDPLPIVNFKWDFYVEHVLAPEVGGEGYNQTAMTAFESLVQNYGWYHKLVGGSFDVDWSQKYQCFRLHGRVERRWRTWLWANVLTNRIADSGSRIKETMYAKGRNLYSDCSEDPNFKRGHNVASQKGITSLTTLPACGPLSDWLSVVGYYYIWPVVSGTAPSNPVTSFTAYASSIKFGFQSYSGTFHIAWGYQVDKNTGSGWTRVYLRGWSRISRQVPTTWTYSTSGCARYRARAYNPVGNSVYSSINGGNQICTG